MSDWLGQQIKETRKSRKVMKTTIVMTMLLVLPLVTTTGMAYATEGSNPTACRGDGLYDGKNNPFSQELYDMCQEIGAGDAYYNGFIDGCMSVSNTRDVCESATDATD